MYLHTLNSILHYLLFIYYLFRFIILGKFWDMRTEFLEFL